MKKMFLGMIALLSLLSNAQASCTISPEFFTGGPAPAPYCWNIQSVDSIVTKQDGYLYQLKQDTSDLTQTIYDHHALYYYNGDFYNNILVEVDVYGHPQNTPDLKFNYYTADLYNKQQIVVNSIVVGYRYYFMFYIPENTFEQSGMMEVKDYLNVKDQLWIK